VQTPENDIKAGLRPGKPQQQLEIALPDREAYTPKQFAALFGRGQTWGYRLLYSGRVKAINNIGRLLIPRSEVKRISSDLTYHEGRA
jgi:hypothetical protein